MKTQVIVAMLNIFTIFTGVQQGFCQQGPVKAPEKSFTVGAVTITDKSYYYFVNLDYTGKTTPHEMGVQYGQCILKAVPDFESMIGYYLFEIATLEGLWGKTVGDRTRAIRSHLDEAARDEIDGLASVMKGAWTWTPTEEIYAYSLLPDVIRTSQCSAFGCWGRASVDGKNIVGRNLDWFGGLFKQELPAIQAITRIRYPEGRTIYLFGALGHLGCITGINTNTKILAGILDADVEGSIYNVEGCTSFSFDLRRALERFKTTEEVADFLTDSTRHYTFSHLVVLADERETAILENNIAKAGRQPMRALRHDTSKLNPGISWGHPQMIGAVNGFMLNGQVDNISLGKHAKINTRRWELLLDRITEKTANTGGRFSARDVREIMSSFHGKEPGSLFLNAGDIYNLQTQQMIIYTPGERTVDVYLTPKAGGNLADPGPYYHTIELEP
ncbi:MAG: C45 family peptidase [Bacteroidota bacterium]